MEYIALNKKPFLILLSVLFFSGLWACNNNPAVVEGGLPVTSPTPPAPPAPPAGETGIFYANSFTAQNNSAYQLLISSCKRCGMKRLIEHPGGGATYQRFWGFDSDPKRCKNWNTSGYLQIHFYEKKLPTTAVVSILPQYTGTASEHWGEPFSVTAQANAINENKGFEILLTPKMGLGGVDILKIKSEYSNHVNDYSLQLMVIYGGLEESQTIIHGNIVKQGKRAVKKAVFNCDVYSN